MREAYNATMKPAFLRAGSRLSLAVCISLWFPAASLAEDFAPQVDKAVSQVQSVADDVMSAGPGWLSDAATARRAGLDGSCREDSGNAQ